MYNIIIVGAGGFGREVYQWSLDAFDKTQYQIKGFLANSKNELDGYNIGAPVLGHEDNYKIEENDRFVIAIGNVSIKKEVVEKLKKRCAKFLTLIHPTAITSPNARIGDGVVICPLAIVTDNTEIGDFAMLNVYVYCGHDSIVGEYSILSPYSTLNGGAALGKQVFLATHSIVTSNISVGNGSIIGANSLVLHDIAQNSKILGISKRIS